MQKEEEEIKKKPVEDDEGFIFETSEDIEVYDSFEKMELKNKILRGVYNYGFIKPSAV